MTDETLLQLQNRIESLSLTIDKADIVAVLKNRLDVLRASYVTVSSPEAEAKKPQEQIISDESSVNFQKTLLNKFEQLEAQIKTMRSTVHLSVEPSLTYEKITDTRVRNQLLADNTRMEYALLDTKIFIDFGEDLAFRRFCAFAFFQVEELLSFYYFKKFAHRMNEMRREFVRYDIDITYLEKAKKISDLTSWILIKAYNYEFFESKNNPKTWGLDNLRNIRNLEEHRCTVLIQDKEMLKLEQEYIQQKAERESKTDASGSIPKASRSEILLTQEFYTLKFIKERKFKDVRFELENLYKNVTR